MFTDLFEDGSLQSYISQNIKDPWIDTPFEGYVHMSPKQKGEFGERFVSKFFSDILNRNVKRAPSSTAGYDRLIDEIRTEIKFSLAIRDCMNGVIEDRFIINHVSKDKDWERLVFFGINENEENCRFVWFTKEDFLKHLDSENNCFNIQQGGNKIGNDDYICVKVSNLLKCSFVKSVYEW